MGTIGRHRSLRAAAIRQAFVVFLLLIGKGAVAQESRVDQLEIAFANGASDSVMAELQHILRAPTTAQAVRYEACMLMAECYYQRASMELFSTWNDSAAALLNDGEHELWARVEVNKCRYANFFIKPDQAIGWGNKALTRYRKDKHRAKWKHAYAIYQALGTAHRNIHNGGDVLFAHFDTARTLLHHQPDLIPYWLANLHKAVSNAALDRMASGFYDPALFAPICDREQRAALDLLERYYPSQLVERSTMQNLRGLYHLYANRPDSALVWFKKTENLIRTAHRKEQSDAITTAWLTCMRYQSFVFDKVPWRDNIPVLGSYWDALFDAQVFFAEYARQRATAAGLFFDDQYWFSPLASILSTGARLWELTRDTTYVELSLQAAEKSRRDSWNNAQSFRAKSRPLDAPPENMLRFIQKQLGSKEGVLLCAHNNLAGQKEKIILLAISPDTVVFTSRDLPFSLRNTASLDNKSMRSYKRDYHALFNEVYLPVASILRQASRVRVFPSGDASFIAFDALIADTNSKSLQTADLLVQRHAFVYPTRLISDAKSPSSTSSRNALYIAPTPGRGPLTDLRLLRRAMRMWAGQGVSDTTFNEAALVHNLPNATQVYMAGHCAGSHSRDHEPRHYFSTDTNGFSIRPSDLLPLDLQADLVVHLACRSGLFEADRSGGAISFSRAFLLAGAGQVVSSQYLADEYSSINLLELFRQGSDQGLPKDIALQGAKLAYLEQTSTEEARSPQYWAGWQVHGTPEPLVEPPVPPLLLVGLAFFLIVLIIRWKMT